MILREIIDRSSIAERLSERTRIVEEENDIQQPFSRLPPSNGSKKIKNEYAVSQSHKRIFNLQHYPLVRSTRAYTTLLIGCQQYYKFCLQFQYSQKDALVEVIFTSTFLINKLQMSKVKVKARFRNPIPSRFGKQIRHRNA